MTQNVLLIVAEHPEIRQRFNALFERSRHHLVFCADHVEALERVPEVKPDLVLAPGGTGRHPDARRFLADFRSTESGPLVPFVSYALSDSTSDFGADAHVEKPFDRRDLLNAVAPLLAHGRPDFEVPSEDNQTVVSYPNPFAEQPLPEGIQPEPAPDQVTETGFAHVIEAQTREPALLRDSAQPLAAQDAAPPSSKGAPERSASLDDSQLGLRLSQRIRTLYEALDQVDDYQLLGVDPSASDERIHSAWVELALELHPDRFFLMQSAELKAQVYAVYRRLDEACKRLLNADARASYDRRLHAEQARVPEPETTVPSQPSPLPDLRSHLELETPSRVDSTWAERAEAAFKRGDLVETRLYLHVLLAHNPEIEANRVALEQVESMLGPTV